MTEINTALVQRLIANQFPQWKNLPVEPVANSGWDNRTFHLGEQMLVRLPSADEYAAQVEKEHQWLPKLAPSLPLQIPVPIAMGKPAESYPWKWSIYQWIEGDTATSAHISDLHDFAKILAQFLIALHNIDNIGGPPPGAHNFYRGGALTIYDGEARQAMAALKNKMDVTTAMEIWETALATTWKNKPVWIHGDMSAGNLLVKDGKLNAVIDFGQLGIGDPACDLMIAWTFFKGESREIFRAMFKLDEDTWARGRAWTLWKFMILAAGLTDWKAPEASEPWRIIDEVIADHKRNR